MATQPWLSDREPLEREANTIDPPGGGYFVEALTDRMEELCDQYFRNIGQIGGMVEADEDPPILKTDPDCEAEASSGPTRSRPSSRRADAVPGELHCTSP